MFMNILVNAIDALEEANQERKFNGLRDNLNHVEIRTKLDEFGTQAVIVFRDNGIGMSESVRKQAFNHLFTAKAVSQGTGLGLAIVYQIVAEKHSGTLSISSALGQGTEFIITLPIKSKIQESTVSETATINL